MSFLKNLYKWGVVRTRTDASGATVLVTPSGDIPLVSRYTTKIFSAAASTDGVTDGAIPQLSTIHLDEADLYLAPGRITIPAGTKAIRVIANIPIKYSALDDATYLSLALQLVLNGVQKTAVNYGVAFIATKPADATFAKAIGLHLDTGKISIEGEVTGTCYVALLLGHDCTATHGAVDNSVLIGGGANLQLEVEM